MLTRFLFLVVGRNVLRGGGGGTDFINRNSYSSYSKKRSSRLTQTSVFLQSGLRISEVPHVVQKVNDILSITDKKTNNVRENGPNNEETVIQAFDTCQTVDDVFRLLERTSFDDVTPRVAIFVLTKIKDLEMKDSSDERESFLRKAFVNMLKDRVTKSDDPEIVLKGLKLALKFEDLKKPMLEEVLMIELDNIEQICEAVEILSRFCPERYECYNETDKFWSAILNKADQINSDNVGAVFRTLPCLKRSREHVIKTLEVKLEFLWKELETRTVLDILGVLNSLNYQNKRVLKVISQWVAVNVQNLTEEELLAVVYCFNKLEYVNPVFIRTLEKYIKVRGVQIREKDLVACICDYALNFRIRSAPILEGIGEYFIQHGRDLTAPQIFSISRIFGELNFHPPNGFKFWDILENVLELKFAEFSPVEILNLLMTYIYVERYPLNFVNKIFNRYFLKRMNEGQNRLDAIESRELLYLFQTAMKLGTPSYSGPKKLPKDDRYKTVHRESQVLTAPRYLLEPLAEVVGDINRIQLDVLLAEMPLNAIYIIDMVIYPSKAAKLLRLGVNTKNNMYIAVLIHTKKHYDSSGKHLVGLQAMRIRHLKQLGFKIMEINLSDIIIGCWDRLQHKDLVSYLDNLYKKTLNE